MSLRDQRQEEFAKVWLKKRKGILYLCPRFGKILTSIKVMLELGLPKTLIIYPIETIRKSWEEDFVKWGFDSSKVTFSTTASLWKLAEASEKWDLIIVDEVHLLSEANLVELKAIMDFGNQQVLGLSGTISNKTETELYDALSLEVIARYDIETAIKEKVVTDYQITVVTAILDNTVKYIQPSKKIPQFKVTEYQRYCYLSDKIDEIREKVKAKSLAISLGESSDAYPVLMNELGLLPIQRMQVFKKSLGKLEVTKKLLERAKWNNQRCLIFCGTIEIADQLGIPVFHSKAKDLAVRDAFCRGEGNFLATVDMFEAGVTVRPINVAIINSYDSNPENLAQRLSRITGLEYDNLEKVAKIYIVATNTIERQWLKKALEFFDESKIKYL